MECSKRSTGLQHLGVWLLVVQILLLITSHSAEAMKYRDFNKTGIIKNAWPEYESRNVDEVRQELEAQGVRVFVEEPRDGSPPTFPGAEEDVWLYTDGNKQILGVPIRGIWHPNRLQPGWPELVGYGFEKAAETITAEQIGIKVVYGPKGFTRTADFNLRRVFLDVDSVGNVALTPRLG
ncbi:hypothetical protein R1sor_025661 [Riccia sorocarpa]|uniref:Uncharacterized protein n=1 Tax=Riccia sorocarpa TaxID=122646 RepID=A0ABD3G9R1_9MARC